VRRALVIGAILTATLGLTVTVASGERIQLGNIIVDVDGGFSPKALPKHGFAPITLKARADVSTVDGKLPPPAGHIEIDWDRNGRLSTGGLQRCSASKIENTTTPAAMKACRSALVGEGFASGQVAFPEQAAFPASSKVLVFNGTPRGGHPVALLHAYAFVPAPTTFVIPVDITKIHGGRYGFRTSLTAPVIAGGYGVITHFDIKIHRTYKAKGRSQTYVAARCADGRLQARGSVSFTDGSSLTGSIFRTCRARG
jgi:hypothetical protein